MLFWNRPSIWGKSTKRWKFGVLVLEQWLQERNFPKLEEMTAVCPTETEVYFHWLPLTLAIVTAHRGEWRAANTWISTKTFISMWRVSKPPEILRQSTQSSDWYTSPKLQAGMSHEKSTSLRLIAQGPATEAGCWLIIAAEVGKTREPRVAGRASGTSAEQWVIPMSAAQFRHQGSRVPGHPQRARQ